MKKTLLLLIVILSCSFLKAQQAYYNDVNLNLTGLNLKNELGTKLGTNINFLSYAEAYQVIKDTDEDISNNANVILFYTGTSVLEGSTVGGGNSTLPEIWNREHVFAQSQGTPNIGTSGPGSDVHNLRACDAGVNNARASKLFATGSGNNGNVGSNYYPGDNYKGDVARIVMYMYTRYGTQCLPSNVGIGSSASTPDDMIDLFLTWNAEDPVSPIEAQRNTVLQTEQGNRNPFIDNPYLATIIWGGNPAEDIWGIYTTPDTQDPTTPTNLVASNPTSGSIQLNWTASTDNNAVVSYDIYQGGTNLYNSPTNSFNVTGLNSSENYCFTVVAIDAAGNESTQSIQDCETTLMSGATGTDCAIEDFENIDTNNSSQYLIRTWQDNNNQTWEATDARTDQSITGKAITIRNGTLTSPTANGGIGNLTVTTKRVFGGSSGTFNVFINGSTTSSGTIPYGDQDVLTTTTLSNINIEGNITVVLEQTISSNRVAIDDLSWTCFTTLSNNNFSLSNNFEIYPNPINNGLFHINTEEDLMVSIFDLSGKKLLSKAVNSNDNRLDVSEFNSGIYIIIINNGNQKLTKKIIIN